MSKRSKVFRLAAVVCLRPEEFGGLAFVPTSGEIIQLNKSAHDLLSRIIEEKEIVANSKQCNFWRQFEKRGIVKEVGLL